MARTPAAPKAAHKAASNKGEWTQFTNIPVTEEQAADIYKVYGTADTVEDALTELLADGYRVSFSYSPQTDAVTVSVTCKNDKLPNAGMTYTSFAGTWYQALCVALFKHYQIAEGVWNKAEGKPNRPAIG